MPTTLATLVLALGCLIQPDAGQPVAQSPARPAARDAEREWAEIQARQQETLESYQRPEFRPDATPPENAAEWYGLLPKSTWMLVHGPGPRFRWTVFDYDNDRYGLHPASGMDGNPSEAEFARDAHHLAIVNAPAVELFVRASRIEQCDFDGAAHLWENEGHRANRFPQATIRSMSRLVLLDARSHWTSGARRLSLDRIAAVVRAARHAARAGGTGPLAGLALGTWAMREAGLALDEWPEPGPSRRDARELAQAIDVIGPTDPFGVAAEWREDALELAQWIVSESARHGSGGPIAAEVERRCLIMRREHAPRSMLESDAFIFREGPLPLAGMTADQIDAAVNGALPTLERVYELLAAGAPRSEVVEAVRAANRDPEFIEPLLLAGAVSICQLTEKWREERDALLARLPGPPPPAEALGDDVPEPQ